MRRATVDRRKWLRPILGCVLFLASFVYGGCATSMRVQAYFGVDEDYILQTQKPPGRGRGHYFEYVNADEKSYIVQSGDTLWGIARECYGSGAAYQRLWEDNKELVDTPETLQIGTELKISEHLYIGAGMQDYTRNEVMHRSTNVDSAAWDWDQEGYRYQIFRTVTYRNDFGENDPYRHWEKFKKEAMSCGSKICGGRVSELSFARYRVTDLCDLCYYQFVFDGGSKKYLIMAAFSYTDDRKSEEFVVFNGYGEALSMGCENMKSETFTVCDLDRCDEKDLEEAKGKTFYEAARGIDSGVYYPKMADYVGADDWGYSQLHNPFTQAMRSFCDEPLEQVSASPNDWEIEWKDAVLEKLVREELAGLWRLTDEERKAFMERPMMSADLSGIKSLSLYENREEKEVYVQLNGYDDSRTSALLDKENSAKKSGAILTALDDLANFAGLDRLDIYLCESDITDFSAIGELAGLRELCLDLEKMQEQPDNEDLAFLEKLTDLRMLYLYGWDHNGNRLFITPTRSLEKITDLSVLKNCPQLAYLKLTTGNVENYDFLGELPEIYYIDLMGRYDMKNVEPDTALLPNACFIEYYGEQILFDTGRG